MIADRKVVVISAVVVMGFVSGIGAAAAPNSDSGNEFSNNLLSDLAPLLALFGEQFAKQFMSQSMSWADNIIFAMAPLGILTAIIGAIRVGGPSWLKTVIGRARETQASAELELMSSTSHEVCELWNGEAIVRVMGSPLIQELFYVEALDDSEKMEVLDKVFGIFTLDDAIAGEYLRKKEASVFSRFLHMIFLKPLLNHDEERTEPHSSDSSQPEISPKRKKDAPNISLNLNSKRSTWELYLAASLGILVQLAVLVVTGLGTYSPHWKVTKGELPAKCYAYPLTMVGTLVLVTGMFTCASVVEQTTDEDEWVISMPGKKLDARILWLQRSRTVNDQFFDSYAVINKDSCQGILTSRRYRRGNSGPENRPSAREDSLMTSSGTSPDTLPANPTALFEAATVFGTIISICGFVAQFIGSRGMHWSASIAQLAATFLMTIVRAFVRRGLAKRPHAERVPEEHEMDWLATSIATDPEILWSQDTRIDLPRWKIVTGGDASACWSQDRGNQKMVKIRQRLGQLSKWKGPASGPSVSVATAIEEVMNSLALPSLKDDQDFTWSLTSQVDNKDAEILHLTIKKDIENSWTANAAEIEAVLSLWLFHVRDLERSSHHKLGKMNSGTLDDDWLRAGDPASRKQNIRFLGPDMAPLRRDLRWWTPGAVSNTLLKVESSQVDSDPACVEFNHHPFEYHRITGFAGLRSGFPNSEKSANASDHSHFHNSAQSTNSVVMKYECQELSLDASSIGAYDKQSPGHSLAAVADTRLELLFAQHIFSAFMWAVAKRADQIDGQTTAQQMDALNPTAWESFKLNNTTLSRMALAVQKAGLGSLEEAYQLLLPPLSLADKLPVDAAVNTVLGHVKGHEANGNWEEATQIYLKLLEFGTTSDSALCPFKVKAVAAVVEFSRSIALTIELWSRQERDVELLETSKQALLGKLKASVERDILDGLQLMYDRQKRSNGLLDLMPENLPPSTKFPEYLGYTPLHKEVISGQCQITDPIKKYINKKDLLGWTPLHYAVATRDQKDVGECLGNGADPNTNDIMLWTPLHYYASRTDAGLDLLLRCGANVAARGRDGMTPLHCAAMHGNGYVVKALVNARAKVDVQDNSQRTPLHLASYYQHKPIVRYLLEKGASTAVRDDYDRTPMHLAVMGGSLDIVRLLVSGSDPEAKDKTGKTPLSSAASNGHDEVVQLLLEHEVDKDTKDADEGTALHRAARKGHEAVIRVLLKYNADKEAKDTNGETALHQAARNGYEKVVQLLLGHGIDEDDKVFGLPMAARNGCKIAAQPPPESKITKSDDEGEISVSTVLYLAVRNGHEAVVRLLLEHDDIDKDTKDTNKEETPLHRAAHNGHEAIVRLLLEHAANKEAKDADGETALHRAAHNGHKMVVWLLLEHGFNKNARSTSGSTALHFASRNSHQAIVRLLLEHGADKNAKGANEKTALHLATSRSHEAIVRLLLDYDADKDAKDTNGETALSMAVRSGCEAIVRLLLEHNVDKDTKDTDGETALSLAVRSGREAIVRLLLEHGVDKNAKDADGETALHWAVSNGHEGVVRLLLEHDVDKDATNTDGDTALSLAANFGRKDIIRLLTGLVSSRTRPLPTPLSS